MKIFETQRLVVRRLNLADLDLFAKLHANPNVMDIIPSPVLTKLESKQKLEDIITSYQNPNPEISIWAMETKKGKMFIGACALAFDDPKGIEIGYRVNEEFWGQKYGVEIAQNLIKYAFEYTDTNLVYADVNSQNYKSIKILERFMEYKGKTANKEQDTMDLNYAIKRTSYMLRN